MKTYIFKLLSAVLCVTLLLSSAVSCKKENPQDEKCYPLVYCSQHYTDMGDEGSFSLALTDSEMEWKDEIDLDAIRLSGAFENMTLVDLFIDSNNQITVSLKGELAWGSCGKINGELVKGSTETVSVPITEAYANSESVLYKNLKEHKVRLSLNSTYFKKDLQPDDFLLAGALSPMKVKEISNPFVEVEGETYLSQTVTLTLEGQPNVLPYGQIYILDTGVTYNNSFTVSVDMDYCGGDSATEFVNAFELKDSIIIKAHNLNFADSIRAEDISFDGAFKDYAKLNNITVADSDLVILELSFPYHYMNAMNLMGIIHFSGNTNKEGIAFESSVLISCPELKYEATVTDTKVDIRMKLEHGIFNLEVVAPKFYDIHGKEILVTGMDLFYVDENYAMNFDKPKNFKGPLICIVEEAYDIINEKGETVKIPIRCSVNID